MEVWLKLTADRDNSGDQYRRLEVAASEIAAK